MKDFFSCPDTGFLKYVPQPIQHIVIADKASKLGGKITFYAPEDFETLKTQGVTRSKLSQRPAVDGIIFFTLKQFCYGEKLNFSLLRNILDSKYEVHFARENLSITSSTALDEMFPMLYATQFVLERDEPRESWRQVWDALSPRTDFDNALV